jgi:hypothetical protein
MFVVMAGLDPAICVLRQITGSGPVMTMENYDASNSS